MIIDCPSCSGMVILDDNTYGNVTKTDVPCDQCHAVITVTTENGKLKQVTLKQRGNN